MNAALARRSFDGLHGHLLRAPSAKLLAYKHTVKMRETAYMPGRSRIVGDRLNLWTASSLVPAAGDYSLIPILLENLYPNEMQRNHILDLLAFHLQNLGVKIHHALMIRGPQGSGKNTFFEHIYSPMVGAGNFRVQGGAAIESVFNSEVVDVEVLFVDEVVLSNGWATGNAIKSLITDNTILAEAKGEKRRKALTPRVMIISSNDKTPLPIEETDRRYFVPDFGPEKLPGDFYDRLHASLPTAVPAFYAELLSRDVRSFNPAAAPPMTSAKADLQAAVRPPMERQLREMIDDRRGPFVCNVVIPQAVMCELRLAGYSHVTEQMVTRSLKDLGARSLGQLPSRATWQGRPRCWAVRQHDEVEAAGPAGWAQMLTQSSVAHSTQRLKVAAA